jgi:hypothetical protein
MGPTADINASLINASAFSGSELLIDFSTPFQRTASPLVYDGVTFRVVDWAGGVLSKDLAADGNWGVYFSNIPGASGGYALNDFTGNTQLRMEFATDVNRVGLLGDRISRAGNSGTFQVGLFQYPISSLTRTTLRVSRP